MTRKGGTKKTAAKKKPAKKGVSDAFPYDAVALVLTVGMVGHAAAANYRQLTEPTLSVPPRSIKDLMKEHEGEITKILRLTLPQVLPQAAALAALVPKINKLISSGEAETIVFGAYVAARAIRGEVGDRIKPELHKEIWDEVWKGVAHREAIKAKQKEATQKEPFTKWQTTTQRRVQANFRTLFKSTAPIIQKKADRIKSRVESWLPKSISGGQN